MSDKLNPRNLFKNYFVYLLIFTIEIIAIVIFFSWKTIIHSYIMCGILIFSILALAFLIHILMRKRVLAVKRLSYLEDITRNSEQILQNESKYRSLFANNGTAILVVGDNELISDCNKKFLELTGYERDEIIDKLHWEKIVHEDDLKRVYGYDNLRKIDPESAPIEYIMKVKRKDGTIRHVIVTVILLGKIEELASMVDITEMIEKDKALKESEELLSQAEKIASVGSWTYHFDTKILKGSSGFLHILDIKDKIENLTLEYIRENLNFEQFYGTVNEMIETNIPIDKEITYLAVESDKSDKTMYLKIKAKTISENEMPIKIIGIIQDITEKKRIENEISRANKDLKNILYVTSHDLQIPLISIEGFSSLLCNSSNKDLSEETKHYLERIIHNSKKMSLLFKNFFDMSKTKAAKNPFELINTIELIQKVISENKILADKYNAEISFVNSDSMPKIYGDRENLKLFCHHLIANAILYGGKTIQIGYDEAKGYYIKDNGRGIEKSDFEKIFLPGERLDEKHIEGAGMGLTFCKKVIEIHDGKIWVESDGRDKGSTFYFTLSYELIRN